MGSFPTLISCLRLESEALAHLDQLDSGVKTTEMVKTVIETFQRTISCKVKLLFVRPALQTFQSHSLHQSITGMCVQPFFSFRENMQSPKNVKISNSTVKILSIKVKILHILL